MVGLLHCIVFFMIVNFFFFPFCRDCKLEENLLISKGTSVGAGTVITNSVIGRNCVIGKEKGFVALCVVFEIK